MYDRSVQGGGRCFNPTLWSFSDVNSAETKPVLRAFSLKGFCVGLLKWGVVVLQPLTCYAEVLD